MGKDDDCSRKRNKLGMKESPCDKPCKPKPEPKPFKPCPTPSDPCEKVPQQVVFDNKKFPPKSSSKVLTSKAPKKEDFGDLCQKVTGKKTASGLFEQLSKSLPKLPPIPKITINKETLICAVKCTKDWIMDNCDPRKMADKGASGPTRPMKFPYTFSAKFAQFPIKHYVNNQWIWKYYFVSVAVCLPVFYSINKLANSPGNVAKWAEIRRKEAAEHHH